MMPSPVVYVEMELLQRLSPYGEFSIRDLRLLTTLAYKAQRSNKAAGAVVVRQIGALASSAGLPDTQALRRGLERLENAGFLGPLDGEEIFLSESSDGKWFLSARLLNCDGSPHTVTARGGLPVVYLRRDFLEGNGNSVAAALSDEEYVAWLLLLTGVRLPAFGGVDQDYVSQGQHGLRLGNALEEAFSAATGLSAAAASGTILRLVGRGLLEWHDMPMTKLTDYGGKWIVVPTWGIYSNGWGRNRQSSHVEMHPVLVPVRHFPVWKSDMEFVRGLGEGEYEDAAARQHLSQCLLSLSCASEDP